MVSVIMSCRCYVFEFLAVGFAEFLLSSRLNVLYKIENNIFVTISWYLAKETWYNGKIMFRK